MGGLPLGQWAAGVRWGGVREQEALGVSQRSETVSKYLCSPLLSLAVPQRPGQRQPRFRERAYVRMVANAPSPPSPSTGQFPSFSFRFPFLTPTQAPGLPPAALPQPFPSFLFPARFLPFVNSARLSLHRLGCGSQVQPALRPARGWRSPEPLGLEPIPSFKDAQRKTTLFARPAEFLCQLPLPSPPLQVPLSKVRGF